MPAMTSGWREPRTNAPRRVVIDSFPDSVVRHSGSSAVVLVDVLNASTTLVTSLAHGRRTFAASSRREARELAAALDRAILAGEIERRRLEGYDFPDSPSSISTLGSLERPLVLFSSPASELFARANAEGIETYVCSLRNLSATARVLAAKATSVAVIGAGDDDEFSCEDQLACAWLARSLTELGFEISDPRSKEILHRWRDADPSFLEWGNGAASLKRARREEDVAFVLGRKDDLSFACRRSCMGELRREYPVSYDAALMEHLLEGGVLEENAGMRTAAPPELAGRDSHFELDRGPT